MKDYIDRAFMRKYGDDLPFEKMQQVGPRCRRQMGRSALICFAGQLPATWPRCISGTQCWLTWSSQAGMSGAAPDRSAAPPPAVQAAGPEALAVLAAAKMRCGGCGAKVGSSTLRRALERLRSQSPPEQQEGAAAGRVLAGLDSPDDAAIMEAPPAGSVLVHTVDFFRAFWDDPFVFGRIAANHALGVRPRRAAPPTWPACLCCATYSLEIAPPVRLSDTAGQPDDT